MRYLVDQSIAEHVDPVAVERAVWAAFAAWGRGEAATTQRVRAAVPGPAGGMASAMAATVPPYCGGKLYATASGKFTFVNVLFHVDGTMLALLDGDAITALRTPAISSLAIHHLAPSVVTTAGVVGAGRQGWEHVRMLHRTFPDLDAIRIAAAPGTSEAADFATRARDAGLPVVAVDTATEAVAGAHVVVTITNSPTALFAADALSDDTLICAVGATKYDRAEIGPDVVERCATVVCDDLVGSRVEAGDLIQAAAAGRFDWDRAVELKDIAAGTTTVERAGAGTGPALFETQGVALTDVAACAVAYETLASLPD